jgi:hypothetical protein
MIQNQSDRKFCPRCQRNVFPARPPPNMIALFLLEPFYIIYYGLISKDKCPICYNTVLPIDYNYPPFHGTPDSYDPSLLPTGSVVREQATFDKPEGDFIQYTPDSIPSNSNFQNQVSQVSDPHSNQGLNEGITKKFCMFCGVSIKEGAKFCHKCGNPV